MIHTKIVSETQFVVFRLIFGLYLGWHFWTLIPYGAEMFGETGMIPDPYLNPTFETFAMIIPFRFDTSYGMLCFLNTMVLSSLLFAAGISQNLNSLILWFGWAFLFNRNNFIANPGLPYVGWLLLACVLIPDPGSLFHCFSKLHNPETKNKEPTWLMPPLIFWSAWFLMALGYTISGIHKLQCQSWRDGSALKEVLANVLARDNWIVDSLLNLMNTYPNFMRFMTWSSLFLEISFLPLGLFDRLRGIYWISFILLHIGILATVNFTDLTLGVLMIHLFTFDNRFFFIAIQQIKII